MPYTSVSRAFHLVPFGLIAIAMLATPMKMKADILEPDAALIVESTATDTDFGFLTLIAGFQPGQSVAFSSTPTTSGWIASLSGTYLGYPLSVSYIGDLSGFPSGALTWTDTGTYGNNPWSGSGSITITNPTPTTFQVSLIDSLSLGGFTATLDSDIPGVELPDGTIMFGDPSDPEAGSGTADITGGGKTPPNPNPPVPVPPNPQPPPKVRTFHSFKLEKGVKVESDLKFVKAGQPAPNPDIGNDMIEEEDLNPIGGRSSIKGDIYVTPEPATWTLLLAGLGAVFVLGRRGAVRVR